MHTGITWSQARRAALRDTILDVIQGTAFTLAFLLLLGIVGGMDHRDETQAEAMHSAAASYEGGLYVSHHPAMR